MSSLLSIWFKWIQRKEGQTSTPPKDWSVETETVMERRGWVCVISSKDPGVPSSPPPTPPHPHHIHQGLTHDGLLALIAHIPNPLITRWETINPPWLWRKKKHNNYCVSFEDWLTKKNNLDNLIGKGVKCGIIFNYLTVRWQTFCKDSDVLKYVFTYSGHLYLLFLFFFSCFNCVLAVIYQLFTV